MTATLHDFFAHPRAPIQEAPRAEIIPIQAPRREPGIRDRAEATLRNLYDGARAGSLIHRIGLEAISRCEGEPEIARLAGMLIDGLPVVEAPSDVEPTGGDAA